MFTRKLLTVLLLAGLLLSSLAPIVGSSSGVPVPHIPIIINPRAEGILQDAVIWLPVAIPKAWGNCYNFRIVNQNGQEVPYYAIRCFDGDQGALIPPFMSLADYRVVKDLARSFQLCSSYLHINSNMLGTFRTYYVGSILHYHPEMTETPSSTLIQGTAYNADLPPAHRWWAYQVNLNSYFLIPFTQFVTSATLHLQFYPFRAAVFGYTQVVRGVAFGCSTSGQPTSIFFTAGNNVRYWGSFNQITIPPENITAPSFVSRSFNVRLTPGINVLNLNFTASYVNPYLHVVVPGHHVVLILLRIPRTVSPNELLPLYIIHGGTNPFNRATFAIFAEDFEQRTYSGLRWAGSTPSSVTYPNYDGRVWFDFNNPGDTSLEISSTPVTWGRTIWSLMKYEQWGPRALHFMNSMSSIAFRHLVESEGYYGPSPPLPFDMLQWAASWSDRRRWVGAIWFWNTPHHFHALNYDDSSVPRPDYNYHFASWNTWHGINVRTVDGFQPIDFIGVSVSPPQNPLGWNVITFPPQVASIQVVPMQPSVGSSPHLYAQISLPNQILWGGDSLSRGIKIKTGLIAFLNVTPGMSMYTFNPPRSLLTLQLTSPSNTTVFFMFNNNTVASLTVSNRVRWQEGSHIIEIVPASSVTAVHISIVGSMRRLTVMYSSGIESQERQIGSITMDTLYFTTPRPLLAVLTEHQYFHVYYPGLVQVQISYVDYLGRRGAVAVTDAVNVMMAGNADIDVQEDHITVALAFIYPIRANITFLVEPQEVPFLILIPQIEATPTSIGIGAVGERFIFSSLNQSLRSLPIPDYLKPLIASGIIVGSLLTMPVLPATVSASLATIFAIMFIWTGWIPLPPGVSAAAILSLLAALLILVLVSHRLRGKT